MAATTAAQDSVLLHLCVIPEWREYYVPYTVLKEEIKRLSHAVPELHSVTKHHLSTLTERLRTTQGSQNRQDAATTSQDLSQTIATDTSPRHGELERGLTSRFDGTFCGTFAELDLVGSVVLHRGKLMELMGHADASFEGGDASPAETMTSVQHAPVSTQVGSRGNGAANRSFDQHTGSFDYRSSHIPRTRRPFRMFVRTKLTDELALYVSYIEFRAGKKIVQDHCCGLTGEGVERFHVFDQLTQQESTEPLEPCGPTSDREVQDSQQAFLVFNTLHEINVLAMEKLRGYVEVVLDFYNRKSMDVAAATFVVAELSKVKETQLNNRERDKLERMFRRVYFTTQMLQEFGDHNHLIVTQMIEKLMQVTHQTRDPSDALDHLIFFSPPKYGPLALLLQTQSDVFAKYFCDNDLQVATERLKLEQVQNRKEALTKPMLLLHIGILIGLCVGFGITSLVLLLYPVDQGHIGYLDSDVFMFSVSGVLVLLSILFALNVVIWEYYEINFVFSLHLDPTKHFGGLMLLRDHLVYGSVWTGIAFAFIYATLEETMISNDDVTGAMGVDYHLTTLPSYVWAYSLIPCLVAVLLFQWRQTITRREELWLLRTLGRILVTPYFTVEFPDFFICEQLVSIASTLFEVEFVWCQFHSSETAEACVNARGDQYFVLLLLPSIWRVLQSLRRFRDEPFHRSFYPHLLNASKYLVNCIAYSFYALLKISSFEHWDKRTYNALTAMFFIFYSFDNIFKCGYELWVEFGVLRRNPKHWMVRDQILLPKWSYYVATMLNIALRCIWVVKYFAEKYWAVGAYWTYPVFAIAEVLRRALWNIYRVEHDQVSNIESYKVVTFAPSMHHDLPQKALWDVTIQEIEKSLPMASATLAMDFFASAQQFFRALSRSERIVLLESTPMSMIPESPNASVASPSVASASSPGGLDAEMSSRGMHRGEFVRDPRSGLMKTAIRQFAEMPAEDRVRSILHHMAGRTVPEYLQSLHDEGHLETRFYLDFLRPHPQRSWSNQSGHLVNEREPILEQTSKDAASVADTSDVFEVVVPVRRVSSHRQQR